MVTYLPDIKATGKSIRFRLSMLTYNALTQELKDNALSKGWELYV